MKTTKKWKVNEALGLLIDDCYKRITNNPEYLLETYGGPTRLTADIYVARLYGMDDELVEQIFLSEVRPHYLKPEVQQARGWNVEDPMDISQWPRTSMFELRSSYAIAYLDVEYLSKGAPYDESTYRSKILCLRYRLKSLW